MDAGLPVLLARLQAGAPGGGRVVVVIRTIGAVDGGKNRLQTVIIIRADGIEFMIVALGAMHGHGAECIQRVGDHVVAVEVTGDFAIDFFLSDFGVTDEVPRAGGDEAEGGDAIEGAGKEDVAGNLFLHEAGVGFVGIERPDHIISVGPGMGAGLVFVEAVGFAEMHDIEPVAGPAFAVARGGEQGVDQFLPGGIGAGFALAAANELFDFFR